MDYYDYKKENSNDSRPIFILSVVLALVFVALIVLILVVTKVNKSSKGGFPGMPGGVPAATAPAAGNGSGGPASAGVKNPAGDKTSGGDKTPAAEQETANTGKGSKPAGGTPEKKKSGTAVRTVIATSQDLQDYVLTNGDIQTQVSLDVFPSIGGTVVSMNVSLGSYVKKGDILGYVDPSEPGSYYAKSPITAPMSGSILTSPSKVGQKVNVSTVITSVGDINNLQVTAKIPERYVGELKINQKVEISLQAYEDKVFLGKVVKISPVVDSATRTKDVIINFDKRYEEVNAGMFAKVKLFTSVYKDSIVISQDSIVNNGDLNYLYVVKADDTVSKREVTLGKNVDGYYQILSGINPGETVVTEGMLTLYEGAVVRDVGKSDN